MNERHRRIAVVRNEVFQRWQEAAHGLKNLADVHFQMIADVQTLAYVDVSLRLLESEIDPDLEPGEVATLDPEIFFDKDASDADYARKVELISLSRLWVLGAFEIVRSLLAQMKRKQTEPDAALRTRLVSLKKRLAELRTVLAKYERAGGKRGALEYAPIRPFHAGGFGWELPDDSVAVRRQIADDLLEFLEGAQPKRGTVA